MANKRLRDRIGRPLGAVVGCLAMLPAAILACATWIGQRFVVFEPLAPPAWAGTRWVLRDVPDPVPSRAYSGAPIPDPRGFGRTAHRFAASAVTTALVAGIGFAGSRAIEVAPDKTPAAPVEEVVLARGCGSGPDPAMDGQPGWPQVGCDTTEFSARGKFDAATTYAFRDFASETVNQIDGIRAGWTPPLCACRRVRVWWFGGSAGWGWYQRDEFSLPSQLAKAAWDDGIALEVTNFAVPGHVLGQEVRRFAQLTTTDPAPDFAMFYDGGNDLNRQRDRNDEGRGADESETSFAEVQVDDVLSNGPFAWGMEGDRRDSQWATGDRIGFEDVARHAMSRYRRSLRLGQNFSRAADVTPIFVWQPLAPSAPVAAANPDVLSSEDRAGWAEMLSVAKRRLPAEVIDLSDALDGVDGPVFKDVWHTNEHAADIVAKELWTAVRPQLSKVAHSADASPTATPSDG